MCKGCINWKAIYRSYWILAAKIFGVILVLSLIVLSILWLIDTSNKKCEGLFGDTFSLNIKEHENFKEFNQGMCEDCRIDRHSGDVDHKFPFIARLVTKNQQKQIFCGGSLISKKIVLTAAHCVDGLSNKDMEVYVGSGNHHNDLIRRPNFKIIIHPKYNNETNDNDIALIKFDNSVKLSTKLNLICLPFDVESVPMNLTMNEYSSMSFGDSEIKATFIQRDEKFECISKYFNYRNHQRSNVIETGDKIEQKFLNSPFKSIDPLNQFCAGNKIIEKGNSGMPAYANGEKGKLHLYGIVSYGTKMSDSNTLPTIYTKVHSYIHWILCNASD